MLIFFRDFYRSYAYKLFAYKENLVYGFVCLQWILQQI